MSSRTLNICTIDQLIDLVGPLARDRRRALEEVIERFPLRISAHLLPIVARSPAVARQFLPDVREVTTLTGHERAFCGVLSTGIEGVERLYPDRCVIMPQPTCPAYCRFCFRKFYEHADGKAMSYPELDGAIAYVRRERLLREVLITGGEPVMDRRRLSYLLRGLRSIDHVGPIRIACRSLIMDPQLVDQPLVALLADHQDLRAGRPIEVALHCNHPDEITPATIERLALLREGGIHVYNQVVLLRGVNDDWQVLHGLLRELRGYGVETYALFFADPVLGTDYMRPTIDEALALKSALRAAGSGRLNPHLIVSTRLGKVEIGVDGWVVEREPDGRHVWIRTPYRLETFRRIDPRFELPGDARLDDSGFIVMRYLDGEPSAATNSTTFARDLGRR